MALSQFGNLLHIWIIRKQAKVTVEYKCGIWVTMNKCFNVWVSLGLESGTYWWMCYRYPLTTELSTKGSEKTCRSSQMGCPICMEPICKKFWKEE